MPQEEISIREFGRRIGVSDVAVRKAIAAGKIVKGVGKTANGRPCIIPDIALKEWGKNYDPNYVSNGNLRNALSNTKQQTSTEEDTPAATSDTSLAAAKRASAVYRAKILEIELREKQGKLVNKDQVYKALFAMGQELRLALEALPDRVIDELLSAPSRNESHTILQRAINEVLTAISDLENRKITA